MVFDEITLTDTWSSWLICELNLQIHRPRQFLEMCQIAM
jgi:hypothetical protein